MSEHRITVTVNGEPIHAEVEARLLLVHFLREVLGLTGTHVGCDTTSCGACTILLDGRGTKSCTVFAVQANGSEITTIEGLAGQSGSWHPVQEAFRKQHGLQCGFCTPGLVMAAVALLAEQPQPSRAEIREGIAGNICRCTGYQSIVHAIETAASTMAGS